MVTSRLLDQVGSELAAGAGGKIETTRPGWF